MRQVTPETYSKDIEGCWSDDIGRISSFLVFAELENGSIPYLISSKCDVQTDVFPPGKGFLVYLNAIYVVGDDGLLMSRGVHPKQLISNTVTHSPNPKMEAKVYYFIGSFSENHKNDITFYTIVDVLKLKDSGLNLDEFSELKPQQRLNIAEDISNQFNQ